MRRRILLALVLVFAVLVPSGRLHAEASAPGAPPQEPIKGFGFGFGATAYSANLDDLNRAFTAIEDRYRAQGYSIREHPEYEVPAAVWFSLTWQFSPAISLLLDAGAAGSDAEFTASSINLFYHFRFAKQRWFRPYLGAGIGRYHLKIEQKYGDVISPVAADGSYQTLDQITSEGAEVGYDITGGLEFGRRAGVAPYVTALFIPDMETSAFDSEHAVVQLSGVMVGLRVYFHLP